MSCPAEKLHISIQVIDSFPLPYCPKSWDKEKLSIPLEPHHNAQSSEIFFLCQKITALSIFGRKTEHYGAPLEGSTIFLCPSSTCRMSMESHRLAELKYAIFRRTGRKTKRLPRSKLFLWTALKHGLLDGSTILLQYSAITRTPLKSSQLGELKYAISAG